MQIIVGQESLKCVVPADADAYANAAAYPERLWEELIARNGGLAGNMQRAHQELQRLINAAAKTAAEKGILLTEVKIICPQLMSFQGWSDYTERPQDPNFNLNQLRTWFIMRHGVEFVFHIDSAGENVTISFSLRAAPNQKFWCRYDY